MAAPEWRWVRETQRDLQEAVKALGLVLERVAPEHRDEIHKALKLAGFSNEPPEGAATRVTGPMVETRYG